MLKKFREFAIKGSIVNLAVAVVIGGAFGKIVSSLVNDIIMPLVGLLLGKIDFSNLFITLGNGKFRTLAQAKAAGVSTLNYGIFINNIIDFLIISFSIFITINQFNRFMQNEERTKKCKYCYTNIHADASRCPNCTSIIEEE